MSDGMSDMRSQDDQPPFKGWEWRRCGARVEDDTWDGWWRRGVKTWLVTGPGYHSPRFQQSWEGATWCAPATEDLQPMDWPEYPTYTVVTREEFHGHMAAGGRWEYWHPDDSDGYWQEQWEWAGRKHRDKKRALDEHGKPCRLRRVKRIE